MRIPFGNLDNMNKLPFVVKTFDLYSPYYHRIKHAQWRVFFVMDTDSMLFEITYERLYWSVALNEYIVWNTFLTFDLQLYVINEITHDALGRLFLRYDGFPNPVPARELVKIITRIHSRVQVTQNRRGWSGKSVPNKIHFHVFKLEK